MQARPRRPRRCLQCRGLLWKNAVLTRRNKQAVLKEVVVPVLVLLALVALASSGSLTTDTTIPAQVSFPSRSLLGVDVLAGTSPILFAPCDSAKPTDPVKQFIDVFKLIHGVQMTPLVCVPDARTLVRYAVGNYSTVRKRVYAGVVFPDPGQLAPDTQPVPAAQLPVQYRLHLDPNDLSGLELEGAVEDNPALASLDLSAAAFYPKELSLQSCVEQTVAAMLGAPFDPAPPAVDLMELPVPERHVVQNFLATGLVPMYTLLIMGMQVGVLVTLMVQEKETKMKELLKMSGVTDALWWGSWFLTALIKFAVLAAIITGVTVSGGVFNKADWSLLFAFLVVFSASCIAFCFVVVASFSKARTAAVVGSNAFWLAALPAFIVLQTDSRVGLLLAAMPAPGAFIIGVAIFTSGEADSRAGLTWGSVSDASASGLNVSLATVMAAMAASTAVFVLLAWYLDKVIPSSSGLQRHPLFCCGARRGAGCCGCSRVPATRRRRRRGTHSSGCCGCLGRNRWQLLGSSHPDDTSEDRPPGPELVEPVGEDLQQVGAAVVVQGLSKTFPGTPPVHALRSLWFRLYESTLTVMLGVNGSGKTTALNILTGLIPATNGDASVFGVSVNDDIDAVRSELGVCAQENRLIDDMTVKETLTLFGMLRGLSGAQLTEVVHTTITEVGLTTHAAALASTLSGGQKRRLSLGMALVGPDGGPRLLVLDEVCAGIDAQGRHDVWALLRRKKQGRVIILTTHNMMEADVLADRIVVLSRGKLQVAGSTLFLKSRWGLGYVLSVTTPDVDAVVEAVSRHVPQATLVPTSSSSSSSFASVPFKGFDADDSSGAVRTSDVAVSVGAGSGAGAAAGANPLPGGPTQELSFRLPRECSDEFPALLEALDAMGLNRLYGLSATTLEDVFVSLAADPPQPTEPPRRVSAGNAQPNNPPTDGDVELTVMGTPARSPPAELPKRAADLLSTSAAADLADLLSSRTANTPASFQRLPCVGSVTRKHIRLTCQRRSRQSRRDVKGLFMQAVLPILSILLGFFIRSALRGIGDDATHPIAFTPSTQFPALHGTGRLLMARTGDADPTTLASVLERLPLQPTEPHAPTPVDVGVFGSVSSLSAWVASSGESTAVGGMLFEEDNRVTVLYNTSFVTGLPTLLSMFNGALIPTAAGDSYHGLRLQAVYEPFPYPEPQSLSAIMEFVSAALLGFYLALGLQQVAVLQAVAVVKEREQQSKQLTCTMGLMPVAYWLGTWAWDMTLFCVPVVGTLIVVLTFGSATMRTFPSVAAILALVAAFGASASLFTYVLSFLFTKSASVLKYMAPTFSILTTLTFFGSIVLELPGMDMGRTARLVQAVFSLYPPYALAKGVANVAVGSSDCLAASAFQCDQGNPFVWGRAGEKLVHMCVVVVASVAALASVEYNRFKRSVPARSPAVPGGTPDQEDDDVRAERTRVDGLAGDDAARANQVMAQHLSKRYSNAPTGHVAVADLCFAAGPSTVFGLLGPNGAGKTTAVQMLIGSLAPTSGAATLRGFNVTSGGNRGLPFLGICYQDEALFPLLTGEETLLFFAAVKGLPPHQARQLANEVFQFFGMEDLRHRLVRDYSGGNKRKLSFVTACIGAPSVLVLDEPASSVDPHGARRLWQLIKCLQPGRTILLLSHIMNEVESLANTVGILVNGRLACIGSIAHLKALYGTGYSLELRTADTTPGNLDAVRSFVQTVVPGAMEEEQYFGRFRWRLPAAGFNLAATFRDVEAAASASHLHITDFQLSQPSLESLFLQFAKHQRPEAGEEVP